MPGYFDEGGCDENVFTDVGFLAELDDADLGCILYFFCVSVAWNFAKAGHHNLRASKSG